MFYETKQRHQQYFILLWVLGASPQTKIDMGWYVSVQGSKK